MSIPLVDRPEMPDGYGVKPDGAFLSWMTVEQRLIESLHYWLSTNRRRTSRRSSLGSLARRSLLARRITQNPSRSESRDQHRVRPSSRKWLRDHHPLRPIRAVVSGGR